MVPKKQTATSKKKVKKLKASDRAIRIGLVAAIVVFVLIIYIIYSVISANQNKIDLSGEEYYQYFFGVRQEYSGNMKIEQNETDSKLTLEDGKIVYLDSTPIYYKNVLGKVVLPAEMELIIPEDGIYKLERFTNVIEENYAAKIKKFNKKNETEVTGDILYDGKDLYFFLDATTITVGSEEFQVSPLSYAIVNYRNSIEIYDYKTDKYTVINDERATSNDVLATSVATGCTINMSVDSLSTSKGDQLLIKSMSNLKNYKY